MAWRDFVEFPHAPEGRWRFSSTEGRRPEVEENLHLPEGACGNSIPAWLMRSPNTLIILTILTLKTVIGTRIQPTWSKILSLPLDYSASWCNIYWGCGPWGQQQNELVLTSIRGFFDLRGHLAQHQLKLLLLQIGFPNMTSRSRHWMISEAAVTSDFHILIFNFQVSKEPQLFI